MYPVSLPTLNVLQEPSNFPVSLVSNYQNFNGLTRNLIVQSQTIGVAYKKLIQACQQQTTQNIQPQFESRFTSNNLNFGGLPGDLAVQSQPILCNRILQASYVQLILSIKPHLKSSITSIYQNFNGLPGDLAES
ncbi:Hypothetical protein CINCED_3A023906 [Cinara cedri]|uniref:Uncharacterized protein n=1 Tax=Cinara cedri TaxID=506608 RepID=A0A5E4MYU8_9HEMI|nr:Hypothetical protein CINCED_3A023906 [Cinara cedri]